MRAYRRRGVGVDLVGEGGASGSDRRDIEGPRRNLRDAVTFKGRRAPRGGVDLIAELATVDAEQRVPALGFAVDLADEGEQIQARRASPDQPPQRVDGLGLKRAQLSPPAAEQDS